MIRYTTSLHRFSTNQFQNFCVGWELPLSSKKIYAILHAAYCKIIAYDTETYEPVGFVYAISDGILSAYIPMLEVLPAYQHQKIGTELMKLLLTQLDNFYMVDLCCDSPFEKFYTPLGFCSVSGMIKREEKKLR